MLNKIVESCNFLLNKYPAAQIYKTYLDSRLNQTSQDKFLFGYFPGIKDMSSLSDIVGEDELKKLELLASKEITDSLFPRKVLWNYFENHSLIMPFRDTYGKIVALVGRTLLSSEEMKKVNISKYKNTKETNEFKKGNLLFGLYENKQSIIDKNCVYIVEGQFDVIKANEIGFNNIVALGNNNMTSYQFSVISRYTNNIFLLLDNDDAGQKGRKRIVSKFGHLANIYNFYLPDNNKDIDEYITNTKVSSYEEISFVVKD